MSDNKRRWPNGFPAASAKAFAKALANGPMSHPQGKGPNDPVDPCPACNWEDRDGCPRCRGRGWLLEEEMGQ
jgi:hypothetical protein